VLRNAARPVRPSARLWLCPDEGGAEGGQQGAGNICGPLRRRTICLPPAGGWAIFCDAVVTDLRMTQQAGRVNPLHAKSAEPLDGIADDTRRATNGTNGQGHVEAPAEYVADVSDTGIGDEDEQSVHAKVKVWVYYNPITGEASLYDGEPPPCFGRRQYDIGPIELDQSLIKAYVEAKDTWQETRAKFINAVQGGSVLREFDRRRGE
jgi:hypothetical protein